VEMKNIFVIYCRDDDMDGEWEAASISKCYSWDSIAYILKSDK